MRSRTQDRSDEGVVHMLTRSGTCPSNDEIAANIGARGAAAGAAALARLDRAGRIRIEREFGWRKVTLLDNGITREGPDA
jgi:hypothetical protein